MLLAVMRNLFDFVGILDLITHRNDMLKDMNDGFKSYDVTHE